MSGGTKKTIVVAMILITTAALMFGFMAYQVVQRDSKLQVQIATLEEQKAQEVAHLTLQKIADTSLADREQLSGYFLNRESASIDFLNKVESLAPSVGITLKTTALDSLAEKGEDYMWLDVTFEFSGTRLAVQNFIKILETMPYVSHLNSIDMTMRAATDWKAVVSMQVQILSYDEET